MASLLAVLGMALMWSFLMGRLTALNLVVGALLGVLLLSVVERERERSFPRRLWGLVRFVVSFVLELVTSNVLVALLAVRPRPRYHPHIIAVPLRVKSDAAISLLSAAITLLPGTVAMGVSEDRGLLYAHAILQADPERSRASVQRIETLILGFMS
ncbi:MAG: Na+/H+ antiporter subunit E [Deinococcales bacterium]|jgi:multicomponent Na+:H+ antiporter subunit E